MDNIYVKMENVNLLKSNIQNEIKNKLSYNKENFGQKLEKIYLLKNNTTYTGLTPYIIFILKKHKVPYNLVDNRTKPEKLEYFKVNPNYEPRDYQQEIIDRTSSREIIQAATGA